MLLPSLVLHPTQIYPREDHKQFGNENPEIPKNHQPDSPIMSKFKKEYPAVFNGIGKLKGHEVHLHLKDNAEPIVQKPQKIHFISVNRQKIN